MISRVAPAAALGAGALVWAASPELDWPARMLTAILLGPAPIVFLLQAQTVESLPRPLPRVAVYVGSIVTLWLLALVVLAAASTSGISARTMGFVRLPAATLVAWTIVGMGAAAAIVVAFKAAGIREAAIMREITPVTLREKLWFCALSASAGICEEVTFRGFLIPALELATGSLPGAVVLSSLAFGVLHAHQRAGGALRAALMGAVLAVPWLVTGSLYPSMAAHAGIDIIGGLWLARWLFR